MDWRIVLAGGAFAFLGFVAVAVYSALVAGSRADDEMDRLAAEMGWRDDDDPPIGV